MGIREDFLVKLAAMKESATARNATLLAGRPAKALSAEELGKGHPKVSSIIGFQATVYETRMGGCLVGSGSYSLASTAWPCFTGFPAVLWR